MTNCAQKSEQNDKSHARLTLAIGHWGLFGIWELGHWDFQRDGIAGLAAAMMRMNARGAL
jgi:hypothetical protein